MYNILYILYDYTCTAATTLGRLADEKTSPPPSTHRYYFSTCVNIIIIIIFNDDARSSQRILFIPVVLNRAPTTPLPPRSTGSVIYTVGRRWTYRRVYVWWESERGLGESRRRTHATRNFRLPPC